MKKIGKLMAAGCMLAVSTAWSQPQVLDTAFLDVFFDPEGVAAGLSSGDPQTAINSLVDTNTGLIRDDAGIALNNVLSGILVNQDPDQVQMGVEQLIAGLEAGGEGLQGPFAAQVQDSLERIAAGLQAGDPEAVVDAVISSDGLSRGIASEALNDLLNGIVTADPDRGQQGLEDTIGAVIIALNVLSGGAIPDDALPGLPSGGGGGAPALPGLDGLPALPGGGGGLPTDALPVGGLPAGGLPTDAVPLPL